MYLIPSEYGLVYVTRVLLPHHMPHPAFQDIRNDRANFTDNCSETAMRIKSELLVSGCLGRKIYILS